MPSNKQFDPDKSVLVSDAKIDRAGVPWRKKAYWYRQEYISKLTALSHFQDVPVQQLLDDAVGRFIEKNWDNSLALKQTVENSMNRSRKIPV